MSVFNEVDPLLLAAVFSIIICVIMLARSLTYAMVVVSIACNFLLLSMNLSSCMRGGQSCRQDEDKNMPRHCLEKFDSNLDPAVSEVMLVAPTSHETDSAPSLYGPRFDAYQKYALPSQPINPMLMSGPNGGADAAMNALSMRRSRDKKTKTSIAVRDADYYKYHFGDQFAVNENLPWWGRNEF